MQAFKKQKNSDIQKKFRFLSGAWLLALSLWLGGCGSQIEESTDDGMDTQSLQESTSMPSLSQQEDEMSEPIPEPAPEPEKTILWLEDENVRSNPLYSQFLDNEIEIKGKYLYEYLREEAVQDLSFHTGYDEREFFVRNAEEFTVHFMAEDLNQDGQEELLMACTQNDHEWMYLYIFGEKDGELCYWHRMNEISQDGELRYYDNGIFSLGARPTRIFNYNAEGEEEIILEYYIKTNSPQKNAVQSTLYTYINGMHIKTISYWQYFSEDGVPQEISLEAQAVKDEQDAIVREWKEKLGEGTQMCCPADRAIEQGAKAIPLEEALRLPALQESSTK